MFVINNLLIHQFNFAISNSLIHQFNLLVSKSPVFLSPEISFLHNYIVRFFLALSRRFSPGRPIGSKQLNCETSTFVLRGIGPHFVSPPVRGCNIVVGKSQSSVSQSVSKSVSQAQSNKSMNRSMRDLARNCSSLNSSIHELSHRRVRSPRRTTRRTLSRVCKSEL